MRINPFSSIQNNPYKNQVQNMKEEKVQSGFKKDEIQISDEAKKMLSSTKLEQERTEKVSNIKEQVENGIYKINVSETAKSILNYYRKS
jgi:negative regulator of flagellin synthesis FlgM